MTSAPPRVLLDACVMYPTVMREVLLSVAATGAFVPLWSARIAEEWARAARKIGPEGEMQARAEVALAQAAWPDAQVRGYEHLEAQIYLPDPNDFHVLAAAIRGNAELLLTLNRKDFPQSELGGWGIKRQDPDSFLYAIWCGAPDVVATAVEQVRVQAVQMSGVQWDTRGLLKKARLPRLGKALG